MINPNVEQLESLISAVVNNSRMYQDIFATEFVDMFPRTNGDILVHTILAGTGS